MRRILIMITLLVLIAVPAHVSASDTYVFSFEYRSEADLWDGGIFDDADSTNGVLSLAVNNPYGDEINGRVSHVFIYKDSIELESGAIYKISMDVKSLSAPSDSRRSTGIRFGDENRQLMFEFGGMSDKWTAVSQYFMVPESSDYSFSAELKDGTPDRGFLVDNIVIERIDILPETLTIVGDSTLNIPYSGEISSSYRLGAYSATGETINILSDFSVMSAKDLPAGVRFDSVTGTVTVSEFCPDNSSFKLVCQPPKFLSLSPITAEIFLTRNIFKNSDFSQGEDRWIYEPFGEINSNSSGNYLTLYTDLPSAYGYRATLKPDYAAVLLEGAMYVLRARVRVEGDSTSSVYSRNTAVSRDGEVTIDILDLPVGDWVDVIAAFTPDASGIYGITMNFFTPNAAALDISSVTLSPEPSEETYLTLHAPGNIAIPDTYTTFPFSVYVRDQAGSIIHSDCDVSLYPEGKGVTLSHNGIVVSPDAMIGEYRIIAESEYNPLMTETLTFTVSASNIGDGGFEERRVNEWWAAAAPAVMTIEDNGSKYAKIVSNNDYAIVLNNSYMRLYANTPYAFMADVVEGVRQTITVFIETTDGDRIPVIQSGTDEGRIFELFQVEEDLVGRTLLYISSDRYVDVGLDNIELFRAVVSVTVPTLSGILNPGETVEAHFDFFNNLDPTADPSDCIVSWYARYSSIDEAEYIGGGMTMTIPETAHGKYIFCEVTPICKLTGLSGDTMMSIPMIVGSSIEIEFFSDSSTAPPTTEDRPAFPTLSPVRLRRITTEMPFADAREHWAAEEILMLYQVNVVSGKGDDSFGPSDELTRAELAAMICRAFSAKGGNHGFSDVAPGSWYNGYVASVSALGIMNGVSDTRFAPDDPVSREQLVSALVRVYEAMGRTAQRSSLSWFFDYRDISSWAKNDVAKGLSLGIVNGTPTMTFAPHQNATRGEACVMLVRLIEYIEQLEREEGTL